MTPYLTYWPTCIHAYVGQLWGICVSTQQPGPGRGPRAGLLQKQAGCTVHTATYFTRSCVAMYEHCYTKTWRISGFYLFSCQWTDQSISFGLRPRGRFLQWFFSGLGSITKLVVDSIVESRKESTLVEFSTKIRTSLPPAPSVLLKFISNKNSFFWVQMLREMGRLVAVKYATLPPPPPSESTLSNCSQLVQHAVNSKSSRHYLSGLYINSTSGYSSTFGTR
jgi:hypothetical protein